MGQYFKTATKSITAENVFSDPVEVSENFALTITGTWVATVHVQRSTDKGGTWVDVTDNDGTPRTWTKTSGSDPITAYGYEPKRGTWYRAGVKTGNYTSGTIEIELRP